MKDCQIKETAGLRLPENFGFSGKRDSSPVKNQTDFSRQLIEQLKRHEGFAAKPYRCPAGRQTIGYGRNIQDAPLSARELALIGAASQEEVTRNGISRTDAENLLLLEIQRLQGELGRRIPWFTDLDDARQAVLINMAFNLGLDGLLKFKNTLALIKQGLVSGDYGPAAAALLKNNRWYLQVGDGPGGKFDRAEELARQMQTGCWRGAQSGN